ncbi:hypothetical protein T439DRAFT_327347 [Meredithblackwellia eburnea MCA 4105]
MPNQSRILPHHASSSATRNPHRQSSISSIHRRLDDHANLLQGEHDDQEREEGTGLMMDTDHEVDHSDLVDRQGNTVPREQEQFEEEEVEDVEEEEDEDDDDAGRLPGDVKPADLLPHLSDSTPLEAFRVVPVQHEQQEGQEEEEEGDVEDNGRPRLMSKSPPDAPGTPNTNMDYGAAGSTDRDRPALPTRNSKQIFQSATRRLIHAHRVINHSQKQGWDLLSGKTREPGIDPRWVEMPDLKRNVVVQGVDLSREDARYHVLTNDEVAGFLAKPRPEWAKVRWLHVNGLSWDVIKPISLHYNLHPLSLEDLLHHGTSSTRSKADWYNQHLFVSVVVHKTFASEEEDEVGNLEVGDASSFAKNGSGAGSIAGGDGLPEPATASRTSSKDSRRHNHLREQLGFHSLRRPLSESRIESTPPMLTPLSPPTPPLSSSAPPTTSPSPSPVPPPPNTRTLTTASTISSHDRYRKKLRESFEKLKRKGVGAVAAAGVGVGVDRMGTIRRGKGDDEGKEHLDADHASTTGRLLSSNSHGLTNSLWRGKRQKNAIVGDLGERQAALHTVAALTRDIKVHIHVEQLSIFLLRDGTILSFTQDPGFHGRFSSIFDRIQSSSDLIRDSEDPSFILQALLDVVGDHALEIVDEFRDHITRLESRVLARPDMSDVRHLHILSAQLLLLKSTLSPLQHLLTSLRIQDDAKSAAACRISVDTVTKKSLGFVSYDAKIYLEDVIDHVDSVMSSLDLFSSLAENLIAYTFNNLSYSSNAYMQALSVLSVIFLPLTFLSGYFGMNFAVFPAALEGNVILFWQISIPVGVFTTILFSWTYLAEMVRGIRRESMRVYNSTVFRKKMRTA